MCFFNQLEKRFSLSSFSEEFAYNVTFCYKDVFGDRMGHEYFLVCVGEQNAYYDLLQQ